MEMIMTLVLIIAGLVLIGVVVAIVVLQVAFVELC
jgi:hypothetical protein